jgi:hypothetical protein
MNRPTEAMEMIELLHYLCDMASQNAFCSGRVVVAARLPVTRKRKVVLNGSS